MRRRAWTRLARASARLAACLVSLAAHPAGLPESDNTAACNAAECVVVDATDPYFERRSQHKLGDTGEDRIIVSEQKCWLFDHAELVIGRRRFADVQFVELPAKGCIDCTPIVVRWYYEPTGYLDFSVRLFRTRDRNCG